MNTSRRALFLGHFLSYRFLGLLLALLTLVIASPFLGNDVFDRVAHALLLAIVLFAAVGAASTARHVRWMAAALATASGIVISAGLVSDFGDG